MNKKIIATFLIVVALLFSFFLFFIANKGKIEHRLYFPLHSNGELIVEKRVVPSFETDEANLAELVDQILLGSTENIFRKDLFPLNTHASKVLYDKELETLYIDLPTNVLFADAKGSIDIEYSIELLVKNVKSNFKRLKHITVTVGGQPLLIEQ